MIGLPSDLVGFGTWYRSSRFGMLDFDVSVHTDDDSLANLIDELYEPLRCDGRSEDVLTIGRAGHPEHPHYFVGLNERIVIRTPAPSIAFTHLIFTANQCAIERTSNCVRIHAAAAIVHGVTVVIPGGMGAGKSTLVAGLTADGHRYVTDEVVAFEADSVMVRPYARPFSLGAVPEALPAGRFVASPTVHRYLGTSGIFPAGAFGTPADEPSPVGLVVLSQYEPDAPTTVTDLSQIESFVAVASHTFHLDEPGTLNSLQSILGTVPTFRLVSGDLTEAVDAVVELARSVASVSQ